MKTYLVTPRYTLGSDSFHVAAKHLTQAVNLALNKIKREDWHSPGGWEIYELMTVFEDNNE